MKTRRLLILGQSLLLEALGEQLERSGRYALIRWALLPGITELNTLCPDVVLFAQDFCQTDLLFSLTASCPNLFLIGISQDTNQVKIWTGQQLCALSMQDLLQVISAHFDEAESKGGLPLAEC